MGEGEGPWCYYKSYSCMSFRCVAREVKDETFNDDGGGFGNVCFLHAYDINTVFLHVVNELLHFGRRFDVFYIEGDKVQDFFLPP